MRRSILLAILFFCSCGKPLPKKNELVAIYYQQSVDKLIREKKVECNEKIETDVKVRLDSLIDSYINADLLDSLKFPSKPIKPKKPEHIIDKVGKFEVNQ